MDFIDEIGNVFWVLFLLFICWTTGRLFRLFTKEDRHED